jgi:hypothetical protein
MNGGIINSITRLHLVGYFYWVIEDVIQWGLFHVAETLSEESLVAVHMKKLSGSNVMKWRTLKSNLQIFQFYLSGAYELQVFFWGGGGFDAISTFF